MSPIVQSLQKLTNSVSHMHVDAHAALAVSPADTRKETQECRMLSCMLPAIGMRSL